MSRSVTGVALRQIRQLFVEGSVAGLTDAQLLRRFAGRRDEGSFAALVDRHGPMVLNVCRAVLRDRHDAEDAFQATFLILARRAGSLRVAGDSLGGYLHTIAHREARRLDREDARRRTLEREAAAEAARRGATADPDLRAAVHRAVAGLPGRLRLPVVLCHLEGRTHAQAAAELHWGEATVRRRLADARDLLRSRLAREGIVPGVGLLTLLRPDRCAAADAALRAERIARVASATSSSVGVIAAGADWGARLGQLAAGHLRFATLATLGALCFVPGGPPSGVAGPMAGAVQPSRPMTAATATLPADEPTTPPSEPSPAEEPEEADRVLLHGRVERPDGSPAVGARIYAIEPNYDPIDPTPEPEVDARTGPEGRFNVAVPTPKAGEDEEGPSGRSPVTVVAMAEGFGPAFASFPEVGGDLTLRLAPDDVPIEGRVLDVDGRPVVGATVLVRSLLRHPGGDLEPWLEELRREGVAYLVQRRVLKDWSGGAVERLIGPATTGDDGRFRLEGIGRERVVGLWIEGPTIETMIAYARTRAGETLRYPPYSRFDNKGRKVVYHGPRFDHIAGPTPEIVGTVRDADTGAPMAGAVVQSWAHLDYPFGYVQTTTDAEGRYRLTGLSTTTDRLGNDNEILARGPLGEPYPMMTRGVDAGIPTGPITIDFAMKRGVWIDGRVVDQATGEGVADAALEYFIFDDNPHRDDYPGFGYPNSAFPLRTGADGSFRTVGIPGRGIIGARKGNEGYRIGMGAEQFADEIEGGLLPTAPRSCGPSDFNTIVEVDIPEGAEAFSCEIPIDPGHRVEVRPVGPDGAPKAGFWAFGEADVYAAWRRKPEGAETFEVTALGPDDRRLVQAAVEGDRLAGTAVVAGDGPDEITIAMEPWAEVTGRLVDEDGRPFGSAALTTGFRVRESDGDLDIGNVPDEFVTLGEDGRFRIVGLLPGLSYTFMLRRDREILGEPIAGLTVEAGAVKDLGDVTVTRPE